MTGGMAFEALEQLGSVRRSRDDRAQRQRTHLRPDRFLVDRQPSAACAEIRRYMNARNAIERGIKSVPAVGGFAAAGVKSMKAAVREFIEPFAFFETLGVRYIGPIDGHDIVGMEAAFTTQPQFDGPIVVHVLTEKGRGYKPAEEDDEKKLHDVKVFDYEVGPVSWRLKTGDYTEAFSEALVEDWRASSPKFTPSLPPCPGRLG